MFQLLAVRKMLTEVLISVTTSEIESVAKEVYAKEKQKASKGSNALLDKFTTQFTWLCTETMSNKCEQIRYAIYSSLIKNL